MGADDLLTKAASALSVGGQYTLCNPPIFSCADQTHEPFRLLEEPFRLGDGGQALLWGIVRTSGAQFGSDRTDVHDVLSLIWAAVLRAFGLSSVWLEDEPHVVIPGEIEARHLLFQQCPWNISGDGFETARKSMNAWSAFAFHLLNGVFQWDRASLAVRPDLATVHQTEKSKWMEQVIGFLGFPDDITISKRTFPLWIYFASHDQGVTVIRMPKIRVSFLREILKPFAPEMAEGEEALAIFANGIPNAVPYTLEKRARKLLSLSGDECDDVIVLPLDSHCLFIGDKTIIALRGACGRDIFGRERQILIKRRSSENRVFFADSIIEWEKPLCAGDFEDLCVDLVQREPGVVWAKPVGTVNDRDGGRDILIDWRVPIPHQPQGRDGASEGEGVIGSAGTRCIRVIAQVKALSKTVGKRSVQDIRDTIEGHQADGYLLIAYPRISAYLVDHLDNLRKGNSLHTEWWEARDIEDRLRCHPDIAKRYPKLVTLRATA